MDAQILPCVQPSVVRPKHQVVLEESGRRGFAFPQLRNPSNGVPIMNENRIVNLAADVRPIEIPARLVPKRISGQAVIEKPERSDPDNGAAGGWM
jgi:hypothetical protein